jgi:hypothetical protein
LVIKIIGMLVVRAEITCLGSNEFINQPEPLGWLSNR